MDGDCFARLELPQSLVLDDSTLKDHYHAAVAKAENAEPLHQAYATLRDSARRIAHLLSLAGKDGQTSEKPGSSLFDLFFSVSACLKKADGVITSLHAATGALQRASLAGSLITSLGDLTDMLGNVLQQKQLRQEILVSLDSRFPELAPAEWTLLAALGSDFSFLTKWESEIRKRETRLQEMLIGQMT